MHKLLIFLAIFFHFFVYFDEWVLYIVNHEIDVDHNHQGDRDEKDDTTNQCELAEFIVEGLWCAAKTTNDTHSSSQNLKQECEIRSNDHEKINRHYDSTN